MPRNIVICCDGSLHQLGAGNTNIVRLLQALDRSNQTFFYDPGFVGLPQLSAIARLSQTLPNVFYTAFGWGLERRVLSAYRFLMDNWEPGDRDFSIWLHSGRICGSGACRASSSIWTFTSRQR
jgi:uncharacterized protein (DUF2235 family)